MYQSYIGLEIHIQLLTKSKIFCGCRAAFGDEPNTNVCPVCMGYPGVLPSLNEEAVRMSYLVADALHCTLSRNAVFERKNYFYPDLPKNYQISQFGAPFGTNGYVDLEFHKKKKRIRIKECHLEEDAGKMVHAGDVSLLDFNRTGTPLLEIVTEPDFEIGEEAELFLHQFRRMVRYLGVCDGNMEEGSLRCDANVSINFQGQGLGSKVEIKNLNSSKFVKKALNHEIERQAEILDRNGTVKQETRLWNENRDVTETMRSKESAHDYRYFPEPDLPPFRPDDAFIKLITDARIELPAQRKERMKEKYGLTEHQAEFICDEKSRADYYEEAVQKGADPQDAAAWLSADVMKMLNRTGLDLDQSPLTVDRFASLLKLLALRRIHGKIAKKVLEAVFAENKDPEGIIKEKGLEQITDEKEIQALVTSVIDDYPSQVEEIRAGKTKLMGFLVGQIMKKSGGRAEPQAVQTALKSALSVNVLEVLNMGGAITGRTENGVVLPGMGYEILTENAEPLLGGAKIQYEVIGEILSEEILPEQISALIAGVQKRLTGGQVSGVLIFHGTDTLSYTAGLLHWLFSSANVPIVLAASSKTPEDEKKAKATFHAAVKRALSGGPGVCVVIDGVEYPPVNLKFERLGDKPFSVWNSGISPAEYDLSVSLADDVKLPELTKTIAEAMDKIFIAKVFPGMKSRFLKALIDQGIKYFILELYDTGTANVSKSAYSIKEAILYAKEKGAYFFCTSQQEGIVDFSRYITSRELWKDGAVPMGMLTTEAAYTRLLASLIISDDEETAVKRMEE
ncbi:MAG: Asp-tRNA(Asn)/Glu-tRNA(Gln) amidotransferase subunit GatB [Spirochaetia bacterium]